MNVQVQSNYGRAAPSGLAVRDSVFSELPVVDFAAMDGDDPQARAAVAEAIRNACVNVGFFYLKNHRVPQERIDRAFAIAKQFFDRPIDEKMAIAKAKTRGFGGYSPIRELNGGKATGGSVMEGFNMNLELPADDPFVLTEKPFYDPNSWPAEPAAFKPEILAYFDEMQRLGRRIFEAFALALDLPADYFAAMIDKPIAMLRLNHYPDQPVVTDEHEIGTGAHTDYECFTILAQQPGITALQVVNGAGEWISAPPIPGTFVINIGDQMAHWTNGLFVSTMHRVVNTSGRDRQSFAYFQGTDYDTVMKVLPNCVTPGEEARFEDVVAGDYVQGRINSVYGYDLTATPEA